MTTSNVRCHPYPSFTYPTVPNSLRDVSQMPRNPFSDGYGNQFVPYPQPFPNQWYGNYPGYFQYDPGNNHYGQGQNVRWNQEYGYPQINQGWTPSYPIFVPEPPPPIAEEAVQISNQLALQHPVLSHLLTNSLQSPSIHSVSSSTSSEVSARPSVKSPVIQIDDDDDDDPIAEAMAAVGLDPGLIKEIKDQAKNGPTSSPLVGNHFQVGCPRSNDIFSGSATVSGRQLAAPTKDNCLICNRSYKNLSKHTFNHMIRLITGFETANGALVLWIKQNYPVVLARTIYCEICKLRTGIFTIMAMWGHVRKYHSNKHLNEYVIEQICDCCFPKWSQNELEQFGFSKVEQCNAVVTDTATSVEDFCPVCSNFQGQPEEISDIEQHTKHMRQHFRNLIAGNEQPNPNLKSWLKCYDPLSLERDIFCKLCQAASRYLIEHANKHGIQDIDLCFPKWTQEQLVRLGFIDKVPVQSSFQSNIVTERCMTYRQTTAHNTSHSSSTVFVQKTDHPFNLSQSDFDLLDNLETFIKQNGDNQRSTPSPGRFVIDMSDENYSPKLVIEEIVDEDNFCATKVDSSLTIDDGTSAVDKTVDIVDSCLLIDSSRSAVVEQADDTPVAEIPISLNAHKIQTTLTANENVDFPTVGQAGLLKNADTAHNSSIPSTELNSTSCSISAIIDIADDSSIVDTHDSINSGETNSTNRGFIPVDPCTTSLIQSPTHISSFVELANFRTVVLSRIIVWLAVNDPLLAGNELINQSYISQAENIESSMAELSVRKKCCYKNFCQLVNIPDRQPNDTHIVHLEN